MNQYEIRADFDRDTIVVYQAFNDAIATAAVGAQRFVEPFSLNRMTWIKPSYRWLMHRSNWARSAGQERILAVRITRAGWEEALGRAVLTSPERRVYGDAARWREQFEEAVVRVQWGSGVFDPQCEARPPEHSGRAVP